MGTSAPALQLERVSKRYPGDPPVVAVDAVDLTIARGELAAIIGPSGSGKTTLLNLAAGLDRPSEGRIRIAGEPIEGLDATALCLLRRRRMGFVFQSYNLFPVLSAIENVEYTSLIRGDDPRAARERAAKALGLVGLAAKERSLPGQLSGGQQQRVAVARALATQPEVIFADEPTANLDSRSAHALIDLFEELNRSLGATFVFSTHDHKLIDRVRLRIEMQDGRISRA